MYRVASRVERLTQPLDRTALASRVPAFKDHQRAAMMPVQMVLQFEGSKVEAVELAFVRGFVGDGRPVFVILQPQH